MPWNFLECPTEHLLDEAVAVDVRQVKQRVAGLVGGGDGFVALFFVFFVDGSMS